MTASMASRVYNDTAFIAGVQTLCRLSEVPANTLLREYGRYFILNGLTSRLCAYLLAQVHSGRDLLLIMKEGHQQMRYTPERITPPLFRYELIPGDPLGLILIYDSERQLCPILHGAIEGAGERYGEQAQVTELTCMKYGANACRFEIHFYSQAKPQIQYARTHLRLQENGDRQKQHLADVVLSLLPDSGGITMGEIQELLCRMPSIPQEQVRPRFIFEGLRHLQYAGLVASTTNQTGSELTQRRFWRVSAKEVPHIHPRPQAGTYSPVISPRKTRKLNEIENGGSLLTPSQPEQRRKQETGSLWQWYRRQRKQPPRG